VPRAIVFDLKHDELPRSEWIHCLQYLISMQICNRKKYLQQERRWPPVHKSSSST
jgi:hypothetical protein